MGGSWKTCPVAAVHTFCETCSYGTHLFLLTRRVRWSSLVHTCKRAKPSQAAKHLHAMGQLG